MIPDPLPAKLADLERRLPTMADSEVVAAFAACEPEAPEADLIAGEMERRNLDY